MGAFVQREPQKETHMINRRSMLAGLAATALVLAACGGDDDSSDTTEAAAGGEATITIENAWARNSPMMATAGAAYLDITSSVDDALVGASVDASIAGTVEIHETTMAEGDMSDDTMAMSDDTMAMSDDTMAMSDDTMAMSDDTMGGAGAMTMRPVDQIELPAGETVNLKPGGYHVMLLDLAAPLEVGQTFDLTLTFGSGATQTVSVEVREEAP